LGSASSNGTYFQQTILNVIECNENALLTEIEMYLGIVSSQSLQFVVYETPTESGGYGTYDLIHSNVIMSGTGTGWYSSGPLFVPLVAGKSYCIGAAWSDTATFYCDFGAGSEEISWGRKVSGNSNSNYPAPNSISIIAYTGTSFYQNLTISGYSSPGNIVSTAIDLPAAGNWSAVRFSETIPPDTDLSIDVLDDPNVTAALHDWSVFYVDAAGIESDWSNVESSRQCGTPGDFEPDCDVDWTDLEILIQDWLLYQLPPGTAPADIAPQPDGDGIVNFLDFALFAQHWLEGYQ
jgi:hypothetical protein